MAVSIMLRWRLVASHWSLSLSLATRISANKAAAMTSAPRRNDIVHFMSALLMYCSLVTTALGFDSAFVLAEDMPACGLHDQPSTYGAQSLCLHVEREYLNSRSAAFMRDY